MTAKVLASFIGLWLGLALVGAVADGQFLGGYDSSGAGSHAGDAADILNATQVQLQTEDAGLIDKVRAWFSAPVAFLAAWVNILALNSSLFTGDFVMLGWIVRFLLGGPIVMLLLISIFGR